MTRRADAAALSALRARIWALERRAPAEGGATVPVADGIDAALPWGGLPRACLHDILAEDAGAGTGFCALLAGRMAGGAGIVLWCRRRGRNDRPYAPGLAAFGLPTERLITVETGNDREMAWAMEEALRCREVAALVAEPADGFEMVTARRLQLAAESGGGAALVLLEGAARPSRAATTRWRIGARPSAATAWGGPGPPTWHVGLERCRHALPRAWTARLHAPGPRLAVTAAA